MNDDPVSTIPSERREIHLVRRPRGIPEPADFSLVRVPLPELGEGEFLVRNSWMSVDPSMRIRMHADSSEYLPSFALHEPLQGFAVGRIVASRSPEFPVGRHVLHSAGWRDFAVLTPGDNRWRGPVLIDVDEIRTESSYLNALGATGVTAYMGLLEVAALRDGDVVFVSGAAGGVGTLVVQIAKLKGNVVIGSAGSPEKIAFLKERLGVDAAFCYRDGEVEALLRKAAPDGIDVYFDNVGGDHLEAALEVMRPGGRVALCGAIGRYNAEGPAPGPANLFNATVKGLTLRGFLARMFVDRVDEFRADMTRWLTSGQVTPVETVITGLENAPDAFIGMLSGTNVGKTLVRIG